MDIIQPLCRVGFSILANFRHRHRNQKRLNGLRDCRRLLGFDHDIQANIQPIKFYFAVFICQFLFIVCRINDDRLIARILFHRIQVDFFCVGFEIIVYCNFISIDAIIVFNEFIGIHHLVQSESNAFCRFQCIFTIFG